jgi:hypothetical protein
MLADNVAPQPGNPLDAAKDRIHLGPVPDWILPCSFRMDFRPKQPGHVSYLLLSKQIHAEKHQTFVHTAIRLETIQGVQHEAQGRVPFEPGTQNITFHWVKIHRAGTVFDRTALDNIRRVQQEADGFTSPNRLTLTLLLEDVRPGDVLEMAYTLEEHPLLMGDYCGCLFALPEGAPLGKFCFMARFNESRPMEWESSPPEMEPAETQRGGEIQWLWTRDNYPAPRAEENTPPWHIAHPWIQVSDCPDWETVATAFAEAWNVDRTEVDLSAITPEIAAGEGGILQQTEKAIQLVQDQYRYLALDEELDGQPPTAPEVVARRRYGDRKDLSLLLLLLLRRLGLETRLVLVNTHFRKSLAGLLPMPALFNHLVVEYKARGEIRWVDATAKGQGGGSLNRVLRDYGVGLPVTRAGCDLAEAPESSDEANVYRIKESVLLDTAGAASIFGIVVTARGTHAEQLRRQFEDQGVEAIARQRLQMCVNRFMDVKRVGPLEYRDNRTDNEFFLAEVFEIRNFLREDVKSSWYNMEVSADIVTNLLPLPISGQRRTPYALPHPCRVVHILEVYCVSLPPAIVQQRTIENPWLQFTRLRKTLAGNWTVTTTLTTLTDAVPPAGLEEYREAVREIRAQSTWSLLVPVGQDRPHQRSDFGKLPASWEITSSDFPPASRPTAAPRAVAPEPSARSQSPRDAAAPPGASAATAPSGQPGEIHYRRRKRHRRRHREDKRMLLWQAILVGLLVVVLLLLALSLFKGVGEIPIHAPSQNPNLPQNLPQNK